MPRPTDTERRLRSLEDRMAWLDEHGTRGVDILRTQVTNQSADIAEIKGRVDAIDGKIDTAARARYGQYIGIGLALLPIYVLLFLSLFHVTPV